jgi:hypothetical protein
MSSAVGIVGSVASVTPTQATAAPPSTTAQAPLSTSSSAAQVQNPRVVVDPVVGLITEFTSGGSVVSQFPSSAAVAYLRLGLDADGLSKQTASTNSTTFA